MVAKGFIGALLLAGALGATAAAESPDGVPLPSSEPVFLDGGLGFRAARLPALLTLPTIAFILPCIFLIVGGPAVLRVLDIAAPP